MTAVEWVIKDLDKVYEDIMSHLYNHQKIDEILGKIDELQNLISEHENDRN